MRAFRKDFIREITKNKGRFLSVFFIVLLGAAFFSGIRSAEGDMKVSADRYYDEVNYMDLKVLGTLGLTDDDLADIAKTDGVKAVSGIRPSTTRGSFTPSVSAISFTTCSLSPMSCSTSTVFPP